MPNISPNEPSPKLPKNELQPTQPPHVPPPIVPVLKAEVPLAREIYTVPDAPTSDVPTSDDPERRMAEAIARVQSESFRREVHRHDGEMAGDLAYLIRKPFVMRTVIGVLLLSGFVVLRSCGIVSLTRRGTAEETAAQPALPVPPTAIVAPPPAPDRSTHSYFVPAPMTNTAPRTTEYPINPALRPRVPTNYPDPYTVPGMPNLPPGVPDPLGRPKRPGMYSRPGNSPYDRDTQGREIVKEILRRQAERQRQESQQPPNGQEQPPQAFPAEQPMPPTEATYPQQPSLPPQQPPVDLPPGNGAELPPPRL